MIAGNATIRFALVLRAHALTCAIPLEHVIETMRPLAVEPVAAMPDFVEGLAIVRGAALPVISLSALLVGGSPAAASRFVACRAGEHRFVLAASEVLGIHDVSRGVAHELPPLLQHARNEVIEAISVLDRHLLILLNAGRILPDEVWKSLHHEGN